MSAKVASAIYELARGVIDKGGIAEKDVRVLPILFDLAEERWRTITEAAPDYDEVDLPIFLFRVLAPSCALYRDVRSRLCLASQILASQIKGEDQGAVRFMSTLPCTGHSTKWPLRPIEHRSLGLGGGT